MEINQILSFFPNLPVEIRVTNPAKVLWPDEGFTKSDLLYYLNAVHQPLLQYTRGRPVTVIRFPDGINGKSFYQKNAPRYTPGWIHREMVNGLNAILLDDLPTLLWLGTQAALEFHVPFHDTESEYPLELAFDLDPSVPGFPAVVETAFCLKEQIDRLHLPAYPKTSGATGLQVYIPLERRYTYADTRQVGQFVAHYLAERHPRLVTVARRVKDRGDLVYLDYLQHGPGRTLPAPYSPRARPGAPVSAPVTWEELGRGIAPADLTMSTVPERLKTCGDLFAPVTSPQGRAALDGILKFLRRRGP